MPTARVDRNLVLRLYDGGMRAQRIVEYFEDRGQTVKLGTISAILRRSGRGQPRRKHDFLIPWTVREEDNDLHVVKMLRTLNRIRLGEDGIPEYHREDAQRFLRALKDRDAVVHYDPDPALRAIDGWPFFLVPRDPDLDGVGEWDIVRRPESADLPKEV